MSEETKTTKPVNKKRRIPNFSNQIILLQFLASILFLVLAHKYLPLLYRIAFFAVFLFLLVLSYRLIFTHSKSNKKKLIKTLGKALSLFVSFTLFLGCFFIRSGSDAVTTLTEGADVETADISLVVLKDKGIEKVSDIEGLIAYNRSYDEEISAEILSLIKKDMGKEPESDSYSQFEYLGNALYKKKVDAIFFNEAYRDFLEEEFESFSDDTVTIATYTIKTGNSLASSAVADVTRDCFVAYVSGIDTRNAELTNRSRSDANLLIIVNPTTSQVLLLGIPRDYYIYVPAEGKKDKLTHSGNFGVNASIGALEELFNGIEINYYVRINFAATTSIIDAMGGVDVYSPVAFSTLDDQYEIAEGVNHMDGRMALYFMRTRYGLKGGDNARVTNQTRVIRAVMKKMMSFSSITNFNDILNAASKAAKTNMSASEINSLIKFQLENMTDWDIQNYQLKGDGTKFNEKGQSIMVPDDSTVEEAIGLIKSMLNNEVIDLEKAE